MYAYIGEIGCRFFEGVCTPSNATANFCDPPPPSSKRRLVLPYSKCSGQVFARNTITIEIVRVARVLLEHPLCLFMGHEACAVQVAISPTPRIGDYNSGKCFIVILGCSPSVEGWVPKVVHGVSRPRSYSTRKRWRCASVFPEPLSRGISCAALGDCALPQAQPRDVRN